MGEMALIPSFTLFYPSILVILCLFNIFNVYGKFLNFLGFTTFGFKDNFNNEKLLDGICILNELQKNQNTERIENQENGYDYLSKVILI